MGSRKDEILSIAAKCIRKNGYNAVSMRDLASEIGIKPSSLYNHISSKDEILSCIIIKMAEEYTTAMESVINMDEEPISKLKKIIHYHIDINLDNPDWVAALQNDWMHLNSKDKTYFEQMRKAYERNFRSIIEKGIECGQLKPLNPEIMVYLTLSTLRTLYRWYHRQLGVNRKILKNTIVDLLLLGMNQG